MSRQTRQTLGTAALVVLVGWVIVSWIFGDVWGDLVGPIAIGVLLLLAVLTGIWRLRERRSDAR